MNAAQGIVRVHRHDQAVTFQVEGCVRMTESMPMRRCAEQALAGGATELRIDLRHCAHMDSTFLGTLLTLKRQLDHVTLGDFALVSPSPQCAHLLKQMGLEKIFSVLTVEEESPGNWTYLSPEGDCPETFKRTLIQAHQELADLEGPAGEPFRKVMAVVMQEAEAQKLR